MSLDAPYRVGPADAQRIEDALSLIAPKWTTWAVQTLAHANGPLHVSDIAHRIPFISEQNVGKRLMQMHEDGLVTRLGDHRLAPYRLSEFGRSLSSVHRAVFDWSHAHLSVDPMAAAQRTEDAVRRLHLRHSTATIALLATSGPMRFVRIADTVGISTSLARTRLLRLQLDGLVTRTGVHHHDPYVLTEAGRALGPVYEAVEHWNAPYASTSPTPTAPPAAIRSNAAFPLGAEGTRTAAALRRTAAVPIATFSHGTQPWTPAADVRSSSVRAR